MGGEEEGRTPHRRLCEISERVMDDRRGVNCVQQVTPMERERESEEGVKVNGSDSAQKTG